MQMLIKNVNINYSNYENNSDISLVFLHGWGQNIEMMLPIAKPFLKKYNVLIIDLPGFGLSDEPVETWTGYDYADAVYELVTKLKIKSPIIIGHSFGGKIGIIYSLKYKVKKLVLLASPFKRKVTKDTLRIKIYKTMKKIPLLRKLESFAKKHVGSTDYRNASNVMRKVLVNHVNLDLTEEIKNIKCPVLLIWGSNDSAVPLSDAKELEKLIPNAGLVIYDSI
ncbi:MAG: alpha/beta hydrolase, partial [Tenericutes bacterium]|nr:alpha/beta hydrolase [Mycoplasmatota bacterium]